MLMWYPVGHVSKKVSLWNCLQTFSRESFEVSQLTKETYSLRLDWITKNEGLSFEVVYEVRQQKWLFCTFMAIFALWLNTSIIHCLIWILRFTFHPLPMCLSSNKVHFSQNIIQDTYYLGFISDNTVWISCSHYYSSSASLRIVFGIVGWWTPPPN